MTMTSVQMAAAFRDWILNRPAGDFTVEVQAKTSEADNEIIHLRTDYADAQVIFNQIGSLVVIELNVVRRKDNESSFYLHFELNDFDHAKELFEEMVMALYNQKDRQRVKVLLCCSSGITTSYFVEKMRAASELLALDYDFSAVSYNNLFVDGFQADVILLAPQIGYLYEKARTILRDKTVIAIPASVFASYDVSRLIELIARTLAEKEESEKVNLAPVEKLEFSSLPPIIIVSIIVEYLSIRIIYRIYEHGQIVRQDQIIKEKYRLRDLEDMLDVIFMRYSHICIACINTPGVITDGRLTFHSAGVEDVDVQTVFGERYHCRFIFANDANIMAMGFYGTQTKTQNISFYFHPHASRTAGVGNIFHGRLVLGRNALSGEMQYMHKITAYSDDPDVLAKTPEGSLEIVTKYLVSVIANLDPDVIAIHCDMVPDMRELKTALAKYVQPAFIPELVKVDDIIEIMFMGGMMMCIETLAEDGSL